MLDIKELTSSIRQMEYVLENSLLTEKIKEKIAHMHVIDLDNSGSSSGEVEVGFHQSSSFHEAKLNSLKKEINRS